MRARLSACAQPVFRALRQPFPIPNATRVARHLLTTAGRELRILGIESSCDDTAAAVVDARGQILGEAIRGQQQVHEPSGGIVPIEAVRKHVENMPFVVKEALDRSGLGIADVDAVAVTRGPGISSCLSVGLNAAKTLAAVANKPLIGVHHMEAHALTARLCFPDQIHFPFLSLLISGGHTLLLIVHDVNRYTQLGTTRDDSVGDAFDKVARALQLPWKSGRGGGAGAALEAAARHGDPAHLAYKLKVPMSINHQVSSLDFSFSGLKADVFRRVDQQLVSQYGELTTNSDYPATDGAQPPPVFRYSGKPQPTFDPYRTLSTPLADTPTEEDIPALATGQLTPQFVFDMAAAFQTTAAQHLVQKIRLGFQHCRSIHGVTPRALVASGGVASNQFIRDRLQCVATEEFDTPLFCPPPHLCTDNGVMIAWAGLERFRSGLVDDYGVQVLPKWPLESLVKWPNFESRY